MWYLCRLCLRTQRATDDVEEKKDPPNECARVCVRFRRLAGGGSKLLWVPIGRPYYIDICEITLQTIYLRRLIMCTRRACEYIHITLLCYIYILLCTYSYTYVFGVYTNHIIYLPKHVYACAHNIIMCHHRRKHLGTAEDDCEVKVGPIILCTGCAEKTGEYETILKEKNKRKIYLQNCAIEDVNCVIL